MNLRLLALGPLLIVVACGSRRPPAVPLAKTSDAAKAPALALKSPSDFEAITPTSERSRALFTEMNRVLSHPRCANCHPSGDSPLQGMEGRIHDPPVFRGPDDHGVVAMECTTCHQEQNVSLSRVPGAPKWHVAPLEMAWIGKRADQVCAQLKDLKRNGGKSLAEIKEHIAHDALVAWGWAPGANREPAPGTQELMGKLTEAWIATGAHCPEGT
ncbi:MAG: Isoquinoline 1-oxidoreductase subunit [Myxococcaceae bacterium]